MELKESKVDKVIEEAASTMLVTKRRRYPKINLSDSFKQCLKSEIKSLREEGLSDKVIVDRISRAIPFIIDEEKEKRK
jgi:hypothetical protein